MKSRLLIYGVTGYSGELVAQEARRCWQEEASGERPTPGGKGRAWHRPPVLAGRNAARVQQLAQKLQLPWLAAALDDNTALDRALEDVAVVLNVAGPFQTTALPMLKACLRNRCHYLDLSGEYEVFRRLDDYHRDALQRDILLMPGVGFMVVASDYLVQLLKREIPDLHHLRIALSRPAFVSRGSMKTMQATTREGVTVRRHGKLTSVPVGQLERRFALREDGPGAICTAVRLPDLITAPLTTGAGRRQQGVPNVETYLEVDTLGRFGYQVAAALALPLQLYPLKQLVDAQFALWPDGPAESDRDTARQCVVAEGEDRFGSYRASFWLRTNDVYRFSAWAAIGLAEEVLRDLDRAPTGFQTPGGAFFESLQAAFAANKGWIEVADAAQVSDVRVS